MPGRQRPLSPAAAPAAGLHPLPAPLTAPRLLRAPAPLSPVPSFVTPLTPPVPVTSAGNDPRQLRGPRPAHVQAWGWPGGNTRPLAAGLGGAVPGVDAAPECCGLAPGRGSRLRRLGTARQRAGLRALLCARARAAGRAAYPGPQDGPAKGGRGPASGVMGGCQGNLSRGKESSKSLVPSPKLIPRGLRAA